MKKPMPIQMNMASAPLTTSAESAKPATPTFMLFTASKEKETQTVLGVESLLILCGCAMIATPILISSLCAWGCDCFTLCLKHLRRNRKMLCCWCCLKLRQHHANTQRG